MANICMFYGYIVTDDPRDGDVIVRLLDLQDRFRFATHIWSCDEYCRETDEAGLTRITFGGESAWTAHHLHEGDLDGEWATCDDGLRKECVSLRSLAGQLGFGYYLYWEELGCECCCEAARDNRGDELFYRDLYDQRPEDWYDNEEINPYGEAFEFETEEPANERLFREVE